MTEIRAIVTGSRTWDRADWVINALTLLALNTEKLIIVHGAHEKGVDRIVHDWVSGHPMVLRPVELGTLPDVFIPYTEHYSGPTLQPVEIGEDPFPAAWDDPCRPECDHHGRRRQRADGSDYCPAQGLYRNTRMVDAGAHICLAFIRDASRGATDCAGKARAAGIPTLPWGWL